MLHSSPDTMQNGIALTWPKQKSINDALHGIIEVQGRCLQILDTPQFQRLRHIRQIQACHYVFPCAQHTRLEHSLGTYHLAGVVLEKLKKRQPELKITEEDVEMVQMAGLCHDIGHGCFSHMLDYDVFPRLSHPAKFDWFHEERSCEVLEYLVEENEIHLEGDKMKTVQSLILGDMSKAGRNADLEEKRFLWDIIHNQRHGIDVDKFDYLARDSRECNIPIAFDSSRVIKLMRVVDHEICFNERGAENVYDLFHARSRMYRSAYFHKATRAIERMISDALFEANHVLKLHECIRNIPKFCRLDDTILREIVRRDDSSLAKSQAIIKRIEQRKLYKFVDEFVVPPTHMNEFKDKEVKDDDILQFRLNETLTADDIIVQKLTIDYGKKADNPVDSVGFFDDRLLRPKREFISRERVSNLTPANYQDITIRLYTKEVDKVEDARVAFTRYQERIFGREVMRTPSLKRTRDDMANGGHEEEEEDVDLSQVQNSVRRLDPQPESREDEGEEEEE